MLKKILFQKGFTIIEMIISLMVVASLMSLGAGYIKNDADNRLNQHTASALKQITNAAKQYVKDHYASINSYISDGLDYQLSLDELINNHYLSKHAPLINSYGQKHQIQINKEQEGLMRILVLTTGGEIMEEAAMIQTSALFGGDAGYISRLKSDQITGSQLAWNIPLIEYANVGHLATVNYLSKNDIINASHFLRRTKIEDHDEWNSMETDIIMKDHSIIFKDNKHARGLINATGTVFKDGEKSSSQTAKAIEFNSDTNGLSATVVTADYIKPGMIEFNAHQVSDLYKKADNICGNESLQNTNKIFSIKLITDSRDEKHYGNIYSFICGKKDGYELGSGRAYLTSFSGIELNKPVLIQITP